MNRNHMEQHLVLIAGSRWENTPGTDHRLAKALAAFHTVIWVDPPVPFAGPAVVEHPPLHRWQELDNVAPGILRLRVLAPPGPFRPGLRHVAGFLLWKAIGRALREIGAEPFLLLSLSPTVRLPRSKRAIKVLHVTDDWLAGAGMMGLSQRHVEGLLRHNLREADAVTAITPYLATSLGKFANRPDVHVVPNGCEVPEFTTWRDAAESSAPVVLLGQLNERLDFDLLTKIADTGLPLDVIGPRRDHDPATAERLDKFLGRTNVRWLREVPSTEVPRLLGRASVGITPYARTQFNNASFPLKTLEYLAAGLPAVANPSPAVQWLDTALIKVGKTDQEFVEHVVSLAQQQLGEQERAQNQAFARTHTWNVRAGRLLEIADFCAHGQQLIAAK